MTFGFMSYDRWRTLRYDEYLIVRESLEKMRKKLANPGGTGNG